MPKHKITVPIKKQKKRKIKYKPNAKVLVEISIPKPRSAAWADLDPETDKITLKDLLDSPLAKLLLFVKLLFTLWLLF